MMTIHRRRVMSAILSLGLASVLFAPVAGHARVWHGTATHSTAHVYLLRGLMNVFSLGMDDLAAKIRANGIIATVHNHSEYEELAAEAARTYKAGQEGPIVIIGHSLGADAAVLMANRLGELGVPVRLVVPFDPVSPTVAGGNIARVVNLYISNGVGVAVSRGPGFRGILENVDLKGRADVGHVSIDKSARLHQLVLGYVLAAVHSGREPDGERIVYSRRHHHGHMVDRWAPGSDRLRTTSAVGHATTP